MRWAACLSIYKSTVAISLLPSPFETTVNKNMHFLSSFLHFRIISSTIKISEVQLHALCNMGTPAVFHYLSLEAVASHFLISRSETRQEKTRGEQEKKKKEIISSSIGHQKDCFPLKWCKPLGELQVCKEGSPKISQDSSTTLWQSTGGRFSPSATAHRCLTAGLTKTAATS